MTHPRFFLSPDFECLVLVDDRTEWCAGGRDISFGEYFCFACCLTPSGWHELEMP